MHHKLCSLAIVLGALAAGTTSARADEPWYDGCTYVGDAPDGYDFTAACNWHDLCYGGHIAGQTRATCDRTFHEFMDTICYYNYGNDSGCRYWSSTYYGGVGVFGQCFFDGSWCNGVREWLTSAWDSYNEQMRICQENPYWCVPM